MKNKKGLSTLKLLLAELEDRVEKRPDDSHFLCHILKDIGNYEGMDFLDKSGLNKKWADRDHYIFPRMWGAWHMNFSKEVLKETPHTKFTEKKNLEKIEVIKERIKELEDEK